MAKKRSHFSRTTNDFYHKYVKESGNEELTAAQYRKIVNGVFRGMFDMLFTEKKFHITFPNGIGDIYLRKRKPPKPDMDLSSTFGNYYDVKYDKKFAVFDTSRFYGFKLNYWAKRRKNAFFGKIAKGEIPVPEVFSKPLATYFDINE